MGRFFMKPNVLHDLLRLPLIIEQGELAKQIAEFRRLFNEASESDVISQDTSGETILHLMAKNPVFIELSKEVIKKYPQLLSIRNHVGIYPIHTAILNQNSKQLEFLLSIDGPRTDTRDRTIIHHGVNASPEILDLCCNAAPELISEVDGEGYTALERAIESGNTAAQRILLTKARPSQDEARLNL